MELVKGQIVFSRQGRDVTTAYVVTGLEGERALLANGEKRTLETPKRKNIRHLTPTNTLLSPEQTGTNQALRAALAAYVQSLGLNETQGGEQLV